MNTISICLFSAMLLFSSSSWASEGPTTPAEMAGSEDDQSNYATSAKGSKASHSESAEIKKKTGKKSKKTELEKGQAMNSDLYGSFTRCFQDCVAMADRSMGNPGPTTVRNDCFRQCKAKIDPN